LLPIGAPLPRAPPCILHRRFARTAGDRHGFPERVRAPHRGDWFMGNCSWCTGLSLRFSLPPPPVLTAPTMACPPSWTCTCSQSPSDDIVENHLSIPPKCRGGTAPRRRFPTGASGWSVLVVGATYRYGRHWRAALKRRNPGGGNRGFVSGRSEGVGGHPQIRIALINQSYRGRCGSATV